MTLIISEVDAQDRTGVPSAGQEAARYGRERSAHNKYFSEGTRKNVDKYYLTTQKSRAYYERQLLIRCPGRAALEYGCGMGSHSLFLARNGAERVAGIDLSDVAIAKAREAASLRGLHHAEYSVMNAEHLEFADDSFDLICGTAILHHLDLDRALGELARTMRSAGAGVFLEPLGHNPFINLYRRLTPGLRTVDEHPLLMRDLALARRYFRKVTPHFFGLHSLLAVPFHGRKSFNTVLGALETTDATLFRLLPFTRRYAWQVVLVMEQPIKQR
jgi:ubiquinone/menaquinone biosynthesis C-methylase UbiE